MRWLLIRSSESGSIDFTVFCRTFSESSDQETQGLNIGGSMGLPSAMVWEERLLGESAQSIL